MKVTPITTIKTIVDTVEHAGAGVKLFSLVESRPLGAAAVSPLRAYRPAFA